MFGFAKNTLPGHVTIEAAGSGPLAVEENKELTANVQLVINPEGISEIRYQWQSSTNGKKWTSIPGADKERFTPSRSETGLSLRVLLTFILLDAWQSQIETSSDATPPVTAAADDVHIAKADDLAADLGLYADDIKAVSHDGTDDAQQGDGRRASTGLILGEAQDETSTSKSVDSSERKTFAGL